jgi:hypothetical protein
MKKYYLPSLPAGIALLCLLLSACKKEKAGATNCNTVTSINGVPLGYDNGGRLIKEGNFIYSYENSNKTILNTYPGGHSRYQLNDNGCIIKNEAYNDAGKLLQSTTTVRDNRGFATDDVVEWYKTDGSVMARDVHSYTNSFDSNGNLLKTISKTSGIAGATITEYIYDNSQPGLAFIGGGFTMLVKDNPAASHRLLKERKDGADYWAYTWTTDAKGRVIYNKLTPLVSGARGSEATITYQCN